MRRRTMTDRDQCRMRAKHLQQRLVVAAHRRQLHPGDLHIVFTIPKGAAGTRLQQTGHTAAVYRNDGEAHDVDTGWSTCGGVRPGTASMRARAVASFS